jgi:ABC-type branched-subunit amino acid transport system substrate-binding protein
MGFPRGRLLGIPLVGAATLLAAFSGTSGAKSGPPQQSGTLNFGVIAPFTGPAANFGLLLSTPCYAATDLINKAGGVLGHKTNCTSIDDVGDAADAVPNVTRAIATTSNLDIAVGLESNTAATTVPLVNAAKIPIVTTNGLTAFTRNSFSYYWRLTPSDDAGGASFAVWAVRKGYKRVAVVLQNGIGSEGNLPGIKSALPKLGGKFALNLTIPADSSSYSAEVAKVINSHPSALIFSGDTQTTATFMSQYKQLNNGKLPVMITATDSLTPDFYKGLTKVVGVNYVTHDVYLVGATFDPSTPAFPPYKNAVFADRRTKAIASAITSVGPPASAYDGINIFALAMIEAKTTVGSYYNSFISKVVAPSAGAVVVHDFAHGAAALKAGKKIQYVGVVGAVHFNKYHNSAGSFAVFVFNPGGSDHRVGSIDGTQVEKLL